MHLLLGGEGEPRAAAVVGFGLLLVVIIFMVRFDAGVERVRSHRPVDINRTPFKMLHVKIPSKIEDLDDWAHFRRSHLQLIIFRMKLYGFLIFKT